MTAFRDLERLAKDFATDLRKVAWDSGALGGDVIVTLRDILEDTLDRIRTEVFGPNDETAEENASPGSPPQEATAPAAAAPESSRPAGNAGAPEAAPGPAGAGSGGPGDADPSPGS